MLVTFTTVGYGDVSPEGHAGKVVGSVAILAGVVLLAMPLAIVGNNFSKAWEERSKVQLILRVQRTCIDRNISLNGMLQLFEEADTDRSGFLDYLEFHRLLDELGLDYTASEAPALPDLDEISDDISAPSRLSRPLCLAGAASLPPPRRGTERRHHLFRVLPCRLPEPRRGEALRPRHFLHTS